MKSQRGTCSIGGRFVRGGLACVLLLVLVCAEETSAEPVTERTGETVKHGDGVKENPADKMGADIPSGDGTLVKTFTPPLKKEFLPFKGITPVTHVDIQTDPALLDAVPAPDTSTLIKVTVDDVPTDAPLWPLRCEGNLPGRKVTYAAPNFPPVSKEYFWRALVANKLIELDVRETVRQANRVGRDDPRTPKPAQDKLVLWHNETVIHTVTFDAIKPPNIEATFMVRVEDSCGQNGGTLPQDVSLDTDSHTFYSLFIAEDSDSRDLVVKYGVDSDGNGTLSDAEVMGQYEVYGITAEDYDKSQNTLWLVLIGQFKLSNALLHRFTYGTWDPITYKPTSTADTVTLDAACTTHNFGATFAPTGFEEIKCRLYLKANVTMPVYYYASGSPASELVREDGDFVEGLNNYIANLTYDEIDTKYKAAGGVNNEIEEIEFANVDVNFNFSLFGGWVGLGHASGQVGGLTLYVWPAGENCYEIVAGSTIANTEVRDVYDFDYFDTGWGGTTGASRSGASIQCGFDMPGCAEGDDGKAGQVAYVRIMIDGDVATNSRIVEK